MTSEVLPEIRKGAYRLSKPPYRASKPPAISPNLGQFGYEGGGVYKEDVLTCYLHSWLRGEPRYPKEEAKLLL